MVMAGPQMELLLVYHVKEDGMPYEYSTSCSFTAALLIS